MISAPKNIYGPDVFKQFVHELAGPVRVAKFLEVSERTVRRWLAEGSAPRMACLALYWETQYGRAMIDIDHQTEVSLLRWRIQILEEQFQRAKDIVSGLKRLNFGTANEPYFDARGEFLEVVVAPPEPVDTPTLSAKDQARKRAMQRREKKLAHLSHKDYTTQVLQRVRRREAAEKRIANGVD